MLDLFTDLSWFIPPIDYLRDVGLNAFRIWKHACWLERARDTIDVLRALVNICLHFAHIVLGVVPCVILRKNFVEGIHICCTVNTISAKLFNRAAKVAVLLGKESDFCRGKWKRSTCLKLVWLNRISKLLS